MPAYWLITQTQRTIQAFLYTGLVGALALPMTLTTAMKVAFGSKWLVALRRAQAAGKMLAMQLAQVRASMVLVFTGTGACYNVACFCWQRCVF
jgi:hypothetical protein